MKRPARPTFALLLAASLAGGLPTIAGAAPGAPGNGAPSGAHYNLNLIGVSSDKTADMTGASGHVIFVKLSGASKIWLCEAGVDAGCEGVDGFQVLDANGTDGNGALFALPNPDPDGDGTTVYSVFARALGTPGGHSLTTTCATGPGEDGVLGTADDEPICSLIHLELTRDPGRSKFENVSKLLLYIYADVNGDGTLDRVPLFDDSLRGYVWDYDNTGLKLVQLRFYECATIVPAPTDPGGLQVDTQCFGKGN
jgi:hypothetical protein